MKTSEMSVSQLWHFHYANPNNQIVRAAIALRDSSGIRQLQPLLGRCIVAEAEGRIEIIQDESEQEIEELESKLYNAPSEDDYSELEREKEDLEDKVENLERQVEELKEELATHASE